MQRAALAALTLAVTAGIPDLALLPAKAQEAGGVLTTTLSQSLVGDSNYNLDDPSPGTSYYGDTRAAFDYLKETPTQSLALGLDTGLRALDEAGQSFDFVVASPSTAYFDFSDEGANTSFDVGARIRSRRVDYLGPIDIDGPLPDDLTGFQRDSIEYRSDADIGFAIGTNSPSTYDFNLAATNFDYSEDTGRDDLVPRRSAQGDVTWTLQITPVFAAVAAAGYYWYSADNSTDEEINVAEGDVGIAYTPTENLRVRGGLGYADRKRDETIDDFRDTTQHDTGPTVRGDFRYVLPDFTLTGEARWTTAAPQDRLSGVVRGFYNLPRGRISGRVFQRYGGGQDGSDSRVTGAGLGFTHELTRVSSLALDASYATQVDEDDPDDPGIDRTDFTASYIHNLTETVSAQIGYGFRHRVEDPEDATSNRVFLVIGKTFETGL
ncbi:hypothetical protein [Amaricoccus sp.]|uniref:hypothetical protein n=1 Tax=Amaricoccus sp. TaxID=1872485 RepID=UPI00260CB651|nr:hypothetical protein [Amaricoccus sp.]HRO13273.1 hypothetical protein [Amaricoccus sp.]